MSYNGIGLKSAKGSSTSGHVQQSLASNNERTSLLNYKARKQLKKKEEKKGGHQIKKLDSLKSKPSTVQKKMAEHLRKREIEVQVSELRDSLEDRRDDGKLEITDEEIDEKCNILRDKLVKESNEKKRMANLYTSRKHREESGQ